MRRIELQIDGGSRSKNPDWTADEIILAMEFYLTHRDSQIPGKTSSAIETLSEEIKTVAFALGLVGDEKFRNVNGVYMKIMNLRSLDPKYTSEGKVGLAASGKIEKEIWERFQDDTFGLKTVASSIRSQVKRLDTTQKRYTADEPEIEEAVEGRLVTRLHRSRERSRKIVGKKKRQFFEQYGRLFCQACGFDFALAYGSRGQGFIECHHTKPVHEMSENDVTKLSDLALVCANCHRMILAKRPWLSMDELKACINKAKHANFSLISDKER